MLTTWRARRDLAAWRVPPRRESTVPTPAELRDQRASLPRPTPTSTPTVEVTTETLGGVPCVVCRPEEPIATLVHLHGGGFRLGSAAGSAAFGTRMADAARGARRPCRIHAGARAPVPGRTARCNPRLRRGPGRNLVAPGPGGRGLRRWWAGHEPGGGRPGRRLASPQRRGPVLALARSHRERRLIRLTRPVRLALLRHERNCGGWPLPPGLGPP